MAYNAREIHKWVKNVQFTPTGQAAIDIPGVTELRFRGNVTSQLTQVANATYPDHSVTQRIEHTCGFTCQDVEKWDASGATKLYEGAVGQLDWDNQNEVNGSDESHEMATVKINSIESTFAAGSGAQEISVEFEVYSNTGTVHPLTKS